jgi:hypothetical protein
MNEEYYIVITLAAPYGAATHAGIKQPPKIGGDWLFDLLTETAPDAYATVQQDCTAPADELLTSLSELTAAQAKTDIEAHLGVV